MAETNAETPSKRIVASMMARNPNVKNRGFRKAMIALFPHSEIGDCCGFIPDAYHVSPEKKVVTLIEIDDTNPIDPIKADRIADFSFGVEDQEWEVDVVVIDYAGNVKAAVPGFAFMGAYTERFAPPACRDMTPAARAVAREMAAAADAPPMTEAEKADLLAKMNSMGL